MSIYNHNSREQIFVKQYSKTHMTLRQIAHKYDLSKEKVSILLPRPELIAPYGNHTQLWARDKVIERLGEVKTKTELNTTQF